jgi:hypothetical protein
MTQLHAFRIHYVHGRLTQAGAPATLAYDVQAEDVHHALEQFEAEDSHDGASVLSVAIDRNARLAGELQRDPDGHGYALRPDAQCAWVTVGNAAVAVKRTDEGVVIDLYPLGCEDSDAVASTYAFASELSEMALASDTLDPTHQSLHASYAP